MWGEVSAGRDTLSFARTPQANKALALPKGAGSSGRASKHIRKRTLDPNLVATSWYRGSATFENRFSSLFVMGGPRWWTWRPIQSTRRCMMRRFMCKGGRVGSVSFDRSARLRDPAHGCDVWPCVGSVGQRLHPPIIIEVRQRRPQR